MKVETKYNLNQEVWFIEDDEVVKDIVLEIDYNINLTEESIRYYFKENKGDLFRRFKKENKVFTTKEELINSL